MRIFAGANFRYGEILRVRIFVMAKFRQKKNFASVDAKFRHDDSEISFDEISSRAKNEKHRI